MLPQLLETNNMAPANVMDILFVVMLINASEVYHVTLPNGSRRQEQVRDDNVSWTLLLVALYLIIFLAG